jgi:DNA-nicking Smr family endonuclease
MESRLLARIKRGAVPLEAILDLHGHTRETAYEALLRFIVSLGSRGIRTALIITGKGSGKSEGILRRELPRWLCETPLREHIIAYDRADRQHGGSGAWYVRIRQHKLKHDDRQ